MDFRYILFYPCPYSQLCHTKYFLYVFPILLKNSPIPMIPNHPYDPYPHSLPYYYDFQSSLGDEIVGNVQVDVCDVPHKYYKLLTIYSLGITRYTPFKCPLLIILQYQSLR